MVTLAVLAGLVAVLAGAAATHRIVVSAAINRMETRRAQMIAEAGLQRAIAAFDTGGPTRSTQLDDWYTLGTNGADVFTLGNDAFRIQIVDTSGKVNINTATAPQLGRLPLTQDQVDSLMDWRSPSRVARPDGAKDDYYHALAVPYNTKLRRLDSVDELLQVKGFTADTLYDPQNVAGSTIVTMSTNPNQTGVPTLYDLVDVDSVQNAISPSGRPLLNINTATVQQMAGRGIPNPVGNAIIQRRGRGFSGIGQVLAIPQVTPQAARALLNDFEVGGARTTTGRINVNTASADVLETLPGITADVAQQILNKQATGFQSLGDMLTVPGLNKQRMIPLADSLSVNSASYIVRVVGAAGNSTYTIEALLRTDGTTKRFTRIQQPPFNDMTTRWGWDDPSNQISLGDSN